MSWHRLSLLVALGWMALLFYLSSQPYLDVPSLVPDQDKFMHFGAYGVLGALLLGSLRPTPTGYSRAQALVAAAAASLYGVSDEIHQLFVPGRDADVIDWLADTSGALLATLLLAWVSRRLGKKFLPQG